MKFTSVSQKHFVNYNETEAGTVIATGKLIGSSENKYNSNLQDWHIKPLQEGPITVLFGTGALQYHMDNIEMGTVVQVTYLGKEKIEKKGHNFNGTLAHAFDVAVADTWEEEKEAIVEAQQNLPLEEVPVKKAAAKKKKTATKKNSTVDLSDLD